MATETIKSPEPQSVALRTLIRELGLLNINARVIDDGEIPVRISLDGVLDSTELGNATPEEIEYVIAKMKREYRNFNFLRTTGRQSSL